MFKRFADGLVFGAGFTLSFIVMWYVTVFYVQPVLNEMQLERIGKEHPSGVNDTPELSPPENDRPNEALQVPFHELDIDEQIKRSSVIALAEFVSQPDGREKAVITEFLKKEPGTTIYYNVGDEYPSASYFPHDGMRYGDGVVIFFTGSPATMRMSMSYSGERIRGLGDIPLKLFREKCK